MNKKTENKVRELQKKHIPIWSISKINSYNNCAYGYKRTYVGEDRTRGKDNIYSIAGTDIHQILEDIHNDKADISELQGVYDGIISKSEMFGIKFPNKNIENNWRGDIEHFVENFKKLDQQMITEKHFLFEILDNVWIQGYIDAMYRDKNGDVTILDWKTSSKFTGDSLKKAGRQLIMYKLAVEQMTGKKVDKVAWFMIKYIYVNYGKRKSMKSRRKWVEETKNPIKKALQKLDLDDFVVEMMLEESIKNNNLNNLPQEVQDMFTLEDCILYYDVTEDKIEECVEYVKDTVATIAEDSSWNPVEINRGTEFFCNVLCNHRDDCKYLKEYRGEKNETEKQANELMKELFG